jgi:hypothetical protein
MSGEFILHAPFPIGSREVLQRNLTIVQPGSGFLMIVMNNAT